MMDRLMDWLIYGLIACLCLVWVLALAAMAHHGYERISAPRVAGIVKAVGGCNVWGECGALLDNGHKCTLAHPVVGQRAECRR